MDRGHYEERKSELKSRKRWGIWTCIILGVFFWWTIIGPIIGLVFLKMGTDAKKELKELEQEFEEYEHEKKMEIAQAQAEAQGQTQADADGA